MKAVLNEDAIRKSKQLAGYNLLVTSEIAMKATDIVSVYHNLWRIEESFKIMKSQLDARPVYLQKKDTITGHFLICYLTVLLTRLWQIHILNDDYSTEEIFRFLKGFKVAKIANNSYINLTKKSDFISMLASETALPLTSCFLSEKQIEKMLSYRF